MAMMMMMMMMTLISRCHSDGSYGLHRRGDAPFECYWLHPANVKPGRGVGYMPPYSGPSRGDPWPTRVCPPNGISISSAAFQGLLGCPTQTQRDHATTSVAIARI